MSQNLKVKRYSITPRMAVNKDWPITFIATILKETDKAVYLYGHGELNPQGKCTRCGRTLTHPGSILIGIGPECLGNWNLRDVVLDNITEEDIKRLHQYIVDKKVDGWLPKYSIQKEEPWEEEIHIPEKHPMLNSSTAQKEKSAQLIQDRRKPLIKITFPFNKDDLAHVKSLSGRKFHGSRWPKFWTCPLKVDSVESLKGWGFVLDQKLEAFLEKKKLHVDQVEELQIPGLGGKLFPFQEKGVSFIEAKDGRALIADEMGLGKTVQALAWLQLHPEKRPAIIVVPASLKLNWEREAQIWVSNSKTQVLSGTKTDIPLTGDIIIINYDILSAWVGKLQQYNAQTLIIDEVHYTKSNTAKRTKAVKMLGKKITHVIALSGTPVVNRPVEIYNALKLIDDTIVPNFWAYAQRYCGAKHNGFGWDFSGASHTEELHEKLVNTIMLRRLKKDVLKDMPDKIYSILPIEIDNPSEYEHAERDFISWVSKNKGERAAKKASNAEAFVQIEALKQLAIKGKMKQAIEWIENFLDVDGKLVVFTTHKNTIDALMQKFGDRAVKVDGSVSEKARQDAVDRFQNDETCRLFVGNIKAAGVGLTLTAASNVAFLELPWTPGELLQAEDRCHRIGQKNAVNVYYLIASNTIDEKIARMLDSKRKVLDSILDGKETEQESLLSTLINEYKEEKK